MTTSQSSCVGCGAAGVDLAKQVNGYDVLRCCACGLRFVPPQQLRDGLDYDTLYRPDGVYVSHISDSLALMAGRKSKPVRARRIALRQIAGTGPQTLLDVGCGVGAFLHLVQELGVKVWGTDLSRNALQLAERLVGCPLYCGVLSPEAFPDTRFDAISTWEVLEHVADVTGFLGSIYDRLNPGGIVYMSTPNYDSRWMWNDLDRDPRSSPPLHVTFWNSTGLERHLHRAGFRDIRVRALSVPLTSAVRSGVPFAKWIVVADTLLRRSQRRTLLATGVKPSHP